MNTKVVLRERPVEGIDPEKTFQVIQSPMPTLSSANEGSVLVRTVFLSLDPAMRGWLDDVPSYLPPVQIGAVMRGASLGVVTASHDPNFAPGDLVDAQGMGGWQEHFVLQGKRLLKLEPGTDLLAAMGPLGLTGLTAYFGLLDVGKPVAGETLVVSGAAGATGSIVGQIGKLMGLRVVGLAGSDEKCAWLTGELGFDAAINYRTVGGAAGLDKALRAACPKRVDIFFDNTGGVILDAVLRRIAMRGRVVLCGAISQYNSATTTGPANYLSLLTQRATMQGFIVFDFLARYGEARAQLQSWMAEGKLKWRVDVIEGLANAPQGLLKLFNGSNKGKLAVQCSPVPVSCKL